MAIVGIGGLFFRAQNPDSLSLWYRKHLNVGAGCAAPGAGDVDEWSWMTTGGQVVFAPFAKDSDYFPADKSYMLNFRVSDLGQLIEHLESAGIAVETRDEWNDPNVGRFARIQDPEGNPIELWEPPAA